MENTPREYAGSNSRRRLRKIQRNATHSFPRYDGDKEEAGVTRNKFQEKTRLLAPCAFQFPSDGVMPNALSQIGYRFKPRQSRGVMRFGNSVEKYSGGTAASKRAEKTR